MNSKPEPVEKIIINVMQHFGYRYQYQVAKYFEVTAQTLSGWIKANAIPPNTWLNIIKKLPGMKNSKKIMAKKQYM